MWFPLGRVKPPRTIHNGLYPIVKALDNDPDLISLARERARQHAPVADRHMRYSPEHKEETKRRILLAAGRSFRKEGFNQAGIDGLARGAGVTSGAFYGHFRS